jgi:hypothetical protein
MQLPIKLSSIDQEHLQELYDSAGVARDELPYTEAFDEICQGFQDRTFKNASHEQVYGALLKHVRSSTCPAKEPLFDDLDEDQLKQLRMLVPRHSVNGKILPYSDEFNVARAEFNQAAGTDLSEQDFWRALLRATGAKRRPPARRKKPEPAEQLD